MMASGTFPEMDVALVCAASTFFALFWAISAIHKILGWHAFLDSVRDYRTVPIAVEKWTAMAIVIVEGLVALGWTTDALRTLSGLVSAAMLAIYSAAMANHLLRGKSRIDCGCGGEGQPVAWPLVLRNVLILSAALIFGCASIADSRVLGWIDFVSAAGGALALYAAYIASNQLLANSARMSSAGQV